MDFHYLDSYLVARRWGSRSKRITIKSALDQSVAEIEKNLGVEVYGIRRVVKVYGSNANSFFVKTISPKGQKRTFFLKFSRGRHIEHEIEGSRLLDSHLPIPRMILYSKKKIFGLEWSLFEYLPGQLMSEELLQIASGKEKQAFYELELRKERLLYHLHQKASKEIDFKGYLDNRTNSLFHQRMFGNRFNFFYPQNRDSIASFFNHKLVINGKEFPQTINDIILAIRGRYQTPRVKRTRVIIGHGDAHHGNIIVNTKIWFIDSEYADYVPPFMELAKPYYNDLIGNLFFHHHGLLEEFFQIARFEEVGTKLVFLIRTPKKLETRLRITQIKLKTRKKTANRKTKEFLALNDYLLMCHLLTKNPNSYPPNSKILFLAFIPILASFDPFDPESLYRYFSS